MVRSHPSLLYLWLTCSCGKSSTEDVIKLDLDLPGRFKVFRKVLLRRWLLHHEMRRGGRRVEKEVEGRREGKKGKWRGGEQVGKGRGKKAGWRRGGERRER